MSGIGEASAIIAVAQLGINLSRNLIAYVGEVKDAQIRIRSIGNDIANTSSALNQIGDLVEQNPRTNQFNQEGVSSAERCSKECSVIIKAVRNELDKIGWQDGSSTNTSFLTSLYWPFVRGRLELPRAELQRIKADLTLLLTSAWFLRASTSAEKKKYMQDIPKLKKERVRLKQFSELLKDHFEWGDEGAETWEDYLNFREKQSREEEERRAKEHATLLQTEEEERKRKEAEERHKIEQDAIEEYKRRQEETQTRTAENKQNFRDELKGLNLGDKEIDVVLESSRLNFSPADNVITAPSLRPAIASHNPVTKDTTSLTRVDDNKEEMTSVPGGKSLRMPWRTWRYPTQRSLDVSTEWAQMKLPWRGDCPPLMTETWLIDINSFEKMQISSSKDWSFTAMKKIGSEAKVWSRIATLKPTWRSVILDFMKNKNKDEGSPWNLLSLQTPKRWSRIRFLGHQGHALLVQLIIYKPSISQEPRLTNDQFQPQRTLGRSLNKASSKAGTDVLGTNPVDLRSIIRTLEAKKAALTGDEQERIREIEFSIALLENQIRLGETLTDAQRDEFFNSSLYATTQNQVAGQTPPLGSPLRKPNRLSIISPLPSPRPPSPERASRPPMIQEISTHHRHNDRGFKLGQGRAVRDTSRSRERQEIVIRREEHDPEQGRDEIIIRRRDRQNSPELYMGEELVHRSSGRYPTVRRSGHTVETIDSEDEVAIGRSERSPFRRKGSRDRGVRERNRRHDRDSDGERGYYESDDIMISPKVNRRQDSYFSRGSHTRSPERALAIRPRRSFTRERPSSRNQTESNLIQSSWEREIPRTLSRQPSEVVDDRVYHAPDQSRALVRRTGSHHDTPNTHSSRRTPPSLSQGTRNASKVRFNETKQGRLSSTHTLYEKSDDPWTSLLQQVNSKSVGPETLETDEDVNEADIAKSFLRRYTTFRDPSPSTVPVPANRPGAEDTSRATFNTRQGAGVKRVNTAPVSRFDSTSLEHSSPSLARHQESAGRDSASRDKSVRKSDQQHGISSAKPETSTVPISGNKLIDGEARAAGLGDIVEESTFVDGDGDTTSGERLTPTQHVEMVAPTLPPGPSGSSVQHNHVGRNIDDRVHSEDESPGDATGGEQEKEEGNVNQLWFRRRATVEDFE